MKKVFSVLLLTAACAVAPYCHAQDNSTAPALSAPASNAQTVPADPTAQKARQLLDQMVAALGGDAWLTYKTTSQEGRSYSFFHGNPTSEGMLYWRFFQYPDMERRELTKERDVIYIYAGNKGYEKTYKGTAAEDEKTMQEYIRRRQHSLEIIMREWMKDPKTILFYDGQSVADQQIVDVVTILNKDNDQVSIGIDMQSHLPINRRYTWRDPDKYKVEDETIYGNYRKVQGIQTPFTITNKRDGEISGQNFVTHAEYNATFAPDFFNASATYDPKTYHPNDKKK